MTHSSKSDNKHSGSSNKTSTVAVPLVSFFYNHGDAVGLFGLANVQLLNQKQEEVKQSKEPAGPTAGIQSRRCCCASGGGDVHVCLCVYVCERERGEGRGGLQGAGGHWFGLLGAQASLAGGCSENRIFF